MENVSPIITAKNLNLWYGDFKALKDISLDMGEREITALIGPSGCGKSTFLKTLNRMNDLVPGIRIEGDVRLKGQDIFAREMQPTELRRRVGMVFQKANPFPMSIYDNITYGPRLHGVHNKAELDELVESSLKGAALWNEDKDRLKKDAASDKTARIIAQDLDDAKKLKIDGTPCFLVNGLMVRGALSEPLFEAAVDIALEAAR